MVGFRLAPHTPAASAAVLVDRGTLIVKAPGLPTQAAGVQVVFALLNGMVTYLGRR